MGKCSCPGWGLLIVIGQFVAVYRIEFEKWTNERARAKTRAILAGSSFSDHAEKGQFLINYKPHLDRLLR